jgi:hypothetical protein
MPAYTVYTPNGAYPWLVRRGYAPLNPPGPDGPFHREGKKWD